MRISECMMRFWNVSWQSQKKSLKNLKSCDWHEFKNLIYSRKVCFFSVKLRARLNSYVSDDVDLRILKVNYSSRLGVNVIKLAFSPLSSVCVWNFTTTLDSRPIIINIPSLPWPFFPQPVELWWAVFVSAYIHDGCLCAFNSLFELPIKYNVFLGRCTCLGHQQTMLFADDLCVRTQDDSVSWVVADLCCFSLTHWFNRGTAVSVNRAKSSHHLSCLMLMHVLVIK